MPAFPIQAFIVSLSFCQDDIRFIHGGSCLIAHQSRHHAAGRRTAGDHLRKGWDARIFRIFHYRIIVNFPAPHHDGQLQLRKPFVKLFQHEAVENDLPAVIRQQ